MEARGEAGTVCLRSAFGKLLQGLPARDRGSVSHSSAGQNHRAKGGGWSHLSKLLTALAPGSQPYLTTLSFPHQRWESWHPGNFWGAVSAGAISELTNIWGKGMRGSGDTRAWGEIPKHLHLAMEEFA